MSLLAIGILLFAAVHLVPSVAPGLKTAWRNRLGEGGYKGTFSLLLLAAFGLIITGWKSAEPTSIYLPPPGLRHPAMALLLLAFLFMVVSSRNSRLRALVRHPQLTGVALWGIAHLMLNGDSRSLLLFGGMTLWAIIEIIAINRREGVWIKGDKPGWSAELLNVVIAAVAVAVIIFIHPWIAGMPVH